MKRFVVICLFLASCLCMNGFLVVPESPKTPTSGLKTEMVFEAKIENLINLNNIYGSDFLDNEILTNSAAHAMSSYANEFGFIPETIVTDYVKDLYDIDLVITDDINSDMPRRDGFVYLIPRGYTLYRQTVTDIVDMGTYLRVTSDVEVCYHDGSSISATGITMIVENPESSFGYNILNAELLFNTVSYEI